MTICPKCGPFIKFYKEIWARESDGPFEIEFFQHVEHQAIKTDKIIIKERPEGERLEYFFCGHCDQMIESEKKSNWGEASNLLIKKLGKENKFE